MLLKTAYIWILFVFYIKLIVCKSIPTVESNFTESEGNVCRGNYVIKNSSEKFNEIANCTRIEGYLHIVLIDRESRQRLDDISLPLLTEITDYLLIFKIKALTTLEWFPNLRFIQGRKLFFGNALVLRTLPDLRHFGLHRLERIQGGVRFEDVNNLCFSQTSDYNIIAKATKGHGLKSDDNKQLLPGFNFAESRNQLAVKWDYTPVLRDRRIDYFTINLVEFEELDFYHKRFEQNKCADAQHSDEHQMCQKDMPEVPPRLIVDDTKRKPQKRDKRAVILEGETVSISIEPLIQSPKNNTGQFFVFSNVEQILDPEVVLAKIIGVAFKSNDIPDKNETINQTFENHIKTDNGEKRPFDPRIYRIYELYINRSEGNKTMYYFRNSETKKVFKNYRNYYMIIKACTNNAGQGTDCFVAAHHKLMTNATANGDDIDDSSVNCTAENRSVTCVWEEPIRPNGAIISYEIELNNMNKKTQNNIYCVNRGQFIAMKGRYVIDHLEKDQDYSIRIRSKSLVGPSKWTNLCHFNTTVPGGEPEGFLIYLMIGLTSLLVVFIFMAIFCYLKAPKRHNSQIDIISENPEYEKFIVDPDWEVKRSDLKLFHSVGDGAFGRVYYGEIRTGTKMIKCAVKTLNANHRPQYRKNFLKEANIMKSFVDCHHIVKLIGIVSIENPVLVLMEYMINGDLKTYLRSNRPDSDENPNPRVPTWNRIFQMAIEIADGMAYLSAGKYVHRDLAARNCMVGEDLTVKIGDFGMTRDIYDSDYYRKRDAGLIPVRWMSPEALKDGVFTTNSDIWAYGVVLWEMVTLGAQPYQGYSNESVFQNVVRGVRLTEPENCPKKLWRIMQFCWRKNPRTRPSFNEIIEHLLPSANQSFREVCYYLNRKPKKEKAFKNVWYSLIPTTKMLLNDVKQFDDNDNSQYCQMEPQIQRKAQLATNGYTTGQEVLVLSKFSEVNAKNIVEINNCLNNSEKQSDQTLQQKLIEC